MITNMQSSRGNPVPNQFLLTQHNREVFQSYRSMVAKREWTANRLEIVLNSDKWNYSRTTMRYLCQFLGVSGKKEILANIRIGKYTLVSNKEASRW